MIIPSKVYDVLKWIVLIFVPAVIMLISGLGALLGFDATVICGIISLVGTFIGALIGVSTKNYNKSKLINDEDEVE